MASVVHNTCKHAIIGTYFRNEPLPNSGTGFMLYLFDNGGTAAAENIDLDTYSVLTGQGAAEATGGGYGEATLNRNSTDFDVWSSGGSPDDTNDRGMVQIKDVAFTAVSTSITGIYYAVLTVNGTESSRTLMASFDLAGPLTVTAGSTLTIKDAEIRINNS